MLKCPHCGVLNKFTGSRSDGKTICLKCYHVVEEPNIVSGVEVASSCDREIDNIEGLKVSNKDEYSDGYNLEFYREREYKESIESGLDKVTERGLDIVTNEQVDDWEWEETDENEVHHYLGLNDDELNFERMERYVEFDLIARRIIMGGWYRPKKKLDRLASIGGLAPTPHNTFRAKKRKMALCQSTMGGMELIRRIIEFHPKTKREEELKWNPAEVIANIGEDLKKMLGDATLMDAEEVGGRTSSNPDLQYFEPSQDLAKLGMSRIPLIQRIADIYISNPTEFHKRYGRVGLTRIKLVRRILRRVWLLAAESKRALRAQKRKARRREQKARRKKARKGIPEEYGV